MQFINLGKTFSTKSGNYTIKISDADIAKMVENLQTTEKYGDQVSLLLNVKGEHPSLSIMIEDNENSQAAPTVDKNLQNQVDPADLPF